MNQNSKKSQIEISFNWVFVLIAGAAILFFFVRTIGSEMDFTESVTQARAVSTMNSVMTALQQRPNSIAIEDRINYQIYFDCELEDHIYGVARSSSTLPHQLIFSPSFIGESRLIAWVRNFNAPFPVGSMLYLTDEKTKYFFVKSDEEYRGRYLIDYFYDLVPRNITKQRVDQADLLQLDDEGFNNYIIIIAGTAELDNFGFDSRRLSSKIGGAVKIDPGNNEVVFYELDDTTLKEKEKYGYLFEESILGAIISGDPEIYRCVMDKAFEQIRISADVNLERIKKIHDGYPSGHTCRTHYSAISQGFFTHLSDAANSKDYSDVRTHTSQISSLNNQLLQSTCVSLY